MHPTNELPPVGSPEEKQFREEFDLNHEIAVFENGLRLHQLRLAVKSTLTSFGYKCSELRDGAEYRFPILTASGKAWRSQLLLGPDAALLRFVVHVSDDGYPDHLIPDMQELTLRASEAIAIGAFGFHHGSGGVYFAHTADFRDVVPKASHIEAILNVAALPLAIWEQAFQLVRANDGGAEGAIGASLAHATGGGSGELIASRSRARLQLVK